MTIRRLIMCVSLVWLAGCREATAPQAELSTVAAVWINNPNAPALTVPASAHVGESFEVQVITAGSSGCTQVARTTVTSNASGTLIAPYNRQPTGSGFACTAVISSVLHRVTLTFSTPGTKTIWLRARNFDTGEVIHLSAVVTIL